VYACSVQEERAVCEYLKNFEEEKGGSRERGHELQSQKLLLEGLWGGA